MLLATLETMLEPLEPALLTFLDPLFPLEALATFFTTFFGATLAIVKLMRMNVANEERGEEQDMHFPFSTLIRHFSAFPPLLLHSR